MNDNMNKLNSMINFVEVVKENSFTLASDKKGISRAQMSKSVMQLEEHLKTRYLDIKGPNGIEQVKVNELYKNTLQQVLVEYVLPEISIYALFPSRRYLSAKVRTFIDFISNYFGNAPEWDKFISPDKI